MIVHYLHGIGIDLWCILSTLVKQKNIEKIYSIELIKKAVTPCQHIVKMEILKENNNKFIFVVEDFDNLENN